MSKIRLIILLSLLFISRGTWGQIDLDSLNSHNAYRVGEWLKYAVKYALIKGGEAELSLDLMRNGEDFVYYARADAYTKGAAKAVANVHDTYETYFNIVTGLPVRATRTIQENNYWYYNDVLFYQDSGYVWSLKSGFKQVPTPILDILSAFYFARRYLFNQPMHKGQIITLNIYLEDRVIPLKIRYKKTERIKTKFHRKINALLFVPVLDQIQTDLLRREDDLRIWFSDDGNYIPIKILYKSRYGKVKVELIEFKHLNYPMGVKYEANQ